MEYLDIKDLIVGGLIVRGLDIRGVDIQGLPYRREGGEFLCHPAPFSVPCVGGLCLRFTDTRAFDDTRGLNIKDLDII